MTLLLCIILVLAFTSPSLELASVNSHTNKLVSKHLMRDYYIDSDVCFQEAICIPLQNSTCFGTTLPYSSTSLTLAEDSITQFDIQVGLFVNFLIS